MSLPNDQRTVQDSDGNEIPFADIEVRDLAGGLVTIYSDADGTTEIAQPGFQSDANGFYRFYAQPGYYEITVTGPEGARVLARVNLERGVTSLPDITSLSSLNTAALVDGQQFHMTGWRPDSDLGGGPLYYDATRPQTDHDGGTVFALGATPPTDFNDPAQIEAYLNAGSGLSGNGCLVKQNLYTPYPAGSYSIPSIYVSSGGNDTSTGLDSGAPLATILEAVKRLPLYTGNVDTTASSGQDAIIPDARIVLTSGDTFQIKDIRLAASHLRGLEITTSGAGAATLQVAGGASGFLIDRSRAVFDNVVIEPADTGNRHQDGIRLINGGVCRINQNCTLQGALGYEAVAYRGSVMRPGGTYIGTGKGAGSRAIGVHSGSYMVNSDNAETNIDGYSIAMLHDRGGMSDMRGTINNCSIAVQAEDGADAKDLGIAITNCDVVHQALRSGSISITGIGIRSGNTQDRRVSRGGSVYDNVNNLFYGSGTTPGRGTFYNSEFDVDPDESVAENPGLMRFGANTDRGGLRYQFCRGDGTNAADVEIVGGERSGGIRFTNPGLDADQENRSLYSSGANRLLKHKDSSGVARHIPLSDGSTGGTGSAGSGSQYVEINIGGAVYKVLHDGTV